jgi:hypothetical protein
VYTRFSPEIFGQISIHSMKGNCYEKVLYGIFAISALAATSVYAAPVQVKRQGRQRRLFLREVLRSQRQHRKFSGGCCLAATGGGDGSNTGTTTTTTTSTQ